MPTNWGELGGTERTGDVVHVGRGGLASRFASVWDVLLGGFDSPVEERDGGGGGGGGGEDGFTVNWGKRRRERERESEDIAQLVSGVWDNRTLVHLPALTAALLLRDP